MRSDPRHVYVISFDTANADLKYFCSHADQVLDGVAAADIFYGDIINASTYSQRLNPIRANADIGGINFTFLDTSGALSSLMNSKVLAGYGLRAKRVQHWVGEKGAEWSSEYDLIQTQQIHDSIKIVSDGLGYQFTGRDIQRSELENIFDPVVTTLSASVTKTGITFNVNSTTGIDLLQHGPSYSDAPNKEVLYFRVKDEIIRGTAKTSTTFTVDSVSGTLNGAHAKDVTTLFLLNVTLFDTAGVGYLIDGSVFTEIKWTGKGASSLTGVTGMTAAHSSGTVVVGANGRGALGTVPAAYAYDAGATSRTKVTEHIYYELPAIKLAYAILTGTLYGSADTIPDHHQLGISTDWISTSEFTQFPDDIWDTADDTAGVVLRFSGLKKTNAKKFIEEELNFWAGVFNPVLNTGELGLRKMTGVISDAAHSGVLNSDNIIRISGARFDLNDVHNNVSIDWNYDSILKDYTRHTSIADTDSQATWGASKTLELKSKGLAGSRHTDNILSSLFNMWRDRHVWPPFKAQLVLDYSQRKIKVGDIKRLQLTGIPEFTDADSEFTNFDASAEIQSVKLDPTAGTVTVDVFASTSKATPLLLGRSDADPLADAWFTSEGSDISGVGTITSSGSPVLTITAGSLVGADDLSSATATSDNDQGIFYWDGDLNINGEIDITKNVELRVNGFVTFNSAGKINGKGTGLAGGTTGLAGAIGNSQAGGGMNRTGPTTSIESDLIEGVNAKIPNFILENVGGTDLAGTPNNLVGTSGGKGGDYVGHGTTYGTGGQGGGSGAGLVIYCKGASGVAGTVIDLSGDDGDAATAFGLFQPGSGAGGQAGGFALYLVGNTVTETLSDYFVAVNGETPIIGIPRPAPVHPVVVNASGLWYSYYTGMAGRDVSRANLLVDWVPDDVDAEADAAPLADTGTLISFTQNSNTPQTPAENLATLDVTITAPSDTSYSHSMISYKLASDDETQFQRLPYPAKNETTVVLPMDGTEYTFRAYPVNIDGVESADFIQKNFTMSTALGYVGDLATDEFIQYDPGASKKIVVGRDSELSGADSYNNSAFYWRTLFDSIDAFTTTATGVTISVGGGNGGLTIVGPSTAGTRTGHASRAFLVALDSLTWAKSKRLRASVNFFNTLGSTILFSIGWGAYPDASSNQGFGFRINGSATLTGYVDDGTTMVTKNTISAVAGTTYSLEAIFTAGSGVEFFVDGTSYGSLTTNLPTGTFQADTAFHVHINRLSGTAAMGVTVGQYKAQQDA